MTTLLHYPGCSTCRRARAFLRQHDVEVEVVDLVVAPPSAERLRDLWNRSGLPIKKFFNTSGVSYRTGGWKDRFDSTSEDDLFAALAADGKLIKRPILDLEDTVLVGFSEPAWAEAIG